MVTLLITPSSFNSKAYFLAKSVVNHKRMRRWILILLNGPTDMENYLMGS